MPPTISGVNSAFSMIFFLSLRRVTGLISSRGKFLRVSMTLFCKIRFILSQSVRYSSKIAMHSRVNTTNAGGLPNVRISAMSRWLIASKAFTAYSRAGMAYFSSFLASC